MSEGKTAPLAQAQTGVSPAYYRFFPFPAPAKPRQRAKKAAWIRDLAGKLGYRPDPTLAALA
jgi:hypothetical protein